MTSTPEPPIPDYGPAKPSPARVVLRFIAGGVFAFLLMFIAIFFAGGASFESKTVWWAWPLTAIPTVLCAALAYHWRKTRPAHAAGMWTGMALGLLLAGLCFFGT